MEIRFLSQTAAHNQEFGLLFILHGIAECARMHMQLCMHT